MRKVHIDKLDRSGGNGSRSSEEDWLDENTTAAENEWSSANTTFYYWEGSGEAQCWEDLYDAQHGKGSRRRSAELSRMRVRADAEAFCAMLEFSESLTERAIHVIEEMDISASNTGGKSYEKIILAVCSLVYDEHLSSLPAERVQYEQRLIFDETFKELMENNGLGSKELRGIREQVRSKSQFF